MRIHHRPFLDFGVDLTLLRIHQQMYGPQRFIEFGPAVLACQGHVSAAGPPTCESRHPRVHGGFGVDIVTQHGPLEVAPSSHAAPGPGHCSPAASAGSTSTLAGGPPAAAGVGNLLDVMA